MNKRLIVALFAAPIALSSCERETTPAPAASANPAPTPPEPAPAATPAPAAAPAPTPSPTPAPPPLAATPDQLVGSCSVHGVACSDYYGTLIPMVQKACETVGTWKRTACPATGRVGTCTKQEMPGLVNKTHSYPPSTAAIAKQACDHTPGGVFSAP